MHDLPRLVTARTVVTLLQPAQAPLLQRYQAENREHLAQWEGLREAYLRAGTKARA